MGKTNVSGEPAGFWVRFAAFIIDSLLFYALLSVLGIISAIAVPQIAYHSSPKAAQIALLLIYFVGLFGIPCLYYTLMTASTGQTLGKMVFNLKVVQTDGSPLSILRSFLRWLSYFLSTIPLGLGYLFPAFQKDKRALHDLACGTKVIQTAPANQVALILVLVILPFMSVFVIGILAAIAIPRFAQMLEKSRESSTKANLGALKAAASIYYGDHGGKWPAKLEDLVPTYLDKIGPVKATGAFVAGAQNPAGDTVTLAKHGQVPTGSGTGWLYDNSIGGIYVNSTVKDSRGVPYSFYGFE